MPSFKIIGLLVLEKKDQEDFQKFFAIYSHGGHLGHMTWTILALIGQAVSEEKIFEIVDDGRQTDDGAWLSYKLTL